MTDSAEPLVDLRVEDPGWERSPAGVEALAERAAAAALTAAGLAPERCALALLLTCDDEITALNARFRSKAAATNVLSWPTLALEHPPPDMAALERLSGPHPGRIFLGDVALALQTVRKEAESEVKSLEAHVSHLIVHGVLHLVGYDHELEDEAEAMARRESAALSAIGVADPYASGV